MEPCSLPRRNAAYHAGSQCTSCSSILPRMATDPKTVSFLVDQMSGAGAVTARQMFGDWGIYCNRRMVALTSDGTSDR